MLISSFQEDETETSSSGHILLDIHHDIRAKPWHLCEVVSILEANFWLSCMTIWNFCSHQVARSRQIPSESCLLWSLLGSQATI
jgi:hypothetical protein